MLELESLQAFPNFLNTFLFLNTEKINNKRKHSCDQAGSCLLSAILMVS